MARWHNLDTIIQHLSDVASKKNFVKALVTHFGNTGSPTPNAIDTPEYKELYWNINNVANQALFQQFMRDYNSTTPATADNALNPLRILVNKIDTDSNLNFLNDANIAGYFTAGVPIPADPATPFPPTNVNTAFASIDPPGNWLVHRSLNIITYNLDGSTKQPEIDNIMNNGFRIPSKYLILLQGAENYKLTATGGENVHEIGGSNGFKKLYICAQNNTTTPPGYNLTDNKHNLYGFTKDSADKLLWLATYSDEGNYIIVNVQFPKASSGNFPANFKKHITDRLTADPNFKERIKYGYAVFIAGDMGCDNPATELTKVGAPTNDLDIVGFDTPAVKHTYKPASGSGFTEVRDHILFNATSVDATGFPGAINVLNNATLGGTYTTIESITTHLPVTAGVDFYIQHATVMKYQSGPTHGKPSDNPDLTSAKTDDGKIGSMLDTMASQIAKMPDAQLNSIKNLYNFTRGHVAVPVKATGTPPAPAPGIPPATPPAVPTTFPPLNFATVTSTNPSANYNYIPAPTDKFKHPTYAHDTTKTRRPGTRITGNIVFSDGNKALTYINWIKYSQKTPTDPYIFYGIGNIGSKSAYTDTYHFRYNMAGTGTLEIYNHTTKKYDKLVTT